MSREPYLAGSDLERRNATEWALSDPELDAAWMSRGGYGLTRILPLIRWERLRPRPVWGYSDGTALLWALYRRGWRQLVHGPILTSLHKHHDRERVRHFLEQPTTALAGRGEGRAQGPLVGGNLCVLASLCGTAEQLQARGCLVLLEDINEELYRLDRFLIQLRFSGCLEGVSGIVLGDFTNCGDEAQQRVEEMLPEVCLTGVAVGHGQHHHPFLYGAPHRCEKGELKSC